MQPNTLTGVFFMLKGVIEMADINKYASKTGRMIKEDGTVVNIANLIEGMAEASGAIKMEYYGSTIATRPAANTVPVGAIYVAVTSQEAWQSNGTDWVVI